MALVATIEFADACCAKLPFYSKLIEFDINMDSLKQNNKIMIN